MIARSSHLHVSVSPHLARPVCVLVNRGRAAIQTACGVDVSLFVSLLTSFSWSLHVIAR